MYHTLKRHGSVARVGAMVRLTRTLQHAVLVFLTATVVNLSPATAAQQLELQYRDQRGPMLQDGEGWRSGTT